MKRLATGLACAAVVGCATLDRVPDLFRGETPRARYEAAIERAGLGSAALFVDWRAVGLVALRDAPEVTLPHVEAGVFPPGEPVAVAWRVAVRRGQEVVLEVDLPGDTTTVVFLDVWHGEPISDGSWRRLVEGDSGARTVRARPRRDGVVILRAQPELLRGGRFRATLTVRPTLAFPVPGRGERDVGGRFGAPRDGGSRSHHGIDIFAPRGTPVVAAARGVVTRVGVQRLGGSVVWMRTEDGHSLYYAHLDRWTVAEGMWLQPGDTVGFVGNTGNARRTAPHLHFGVYQRGEGPLDPWWFVHRPRAAPPRLAADTTLLGLRVLALADSLPEEPLRVVAAAGDRYRLRLPDGTLRYVEARAVEQ